MNGRRPTALEPMDYRFGYNTLAAANAAEALEIVDGCAAFDLLFTDVIMPGKMNGPQLAQEVAKRHTPLKVPYTSGYAENAITHHGRLEIPVFFSILSHIAEVNWRVCFV